MDSRKIGVILAVLVILLAGVTAFVMMDKSDEKDLKVVYLNKSGYETQVVAKEKGFFDKAGVSIEHITVTGSGSDAVNAMMTGSADIAATGDGPVAAALNKYGDRIVVLCNVNKSTGGQVWVSGPALANDFVIYDKNTNNKAEVAASWKAAAEKIGGKIKLGVQKGATTESELKAWLTFMGIQYSDFDKEDAGSVQLIHIKANQLVSTLDTKDIHVMVASQPFPSNALDLITGSKTIGNNSDNDSYGISCYITTKEVYESKTEEIQKFLKGVKFASEYMSDSANETECVKLCANIFGTDEKNVKTVFDTANFQVDWDDHSASVLYKTTQNKGFTKITLENCKNACPAEIKTYLATL